MYQGTLPPVSNRADWYETMQVFVPETNEPFDLTDANIVVQLSRCPAGDWRGWDYGFYDTSGWAISATTVNGRASAGEGEFTFHFNREDMTGLCPGTYAVGITIERYGFTTQFLLGTVPVLGGGVPK